MSQKKRDGPLSRFPSSQNELQPPADDQFLDADDDDYQFLNDDDDYDDQFLNDDDDDDGGDKRIIQHLFCVLTWLICWVLHDIILIDGLLIRMIMMIIETDFKYTIITRSQGFFYGPWLLADADADADAGHLTSCIRHFFTFCVVVAYKTED